MRVGETTLTDVAWALSGELFGEHTYPRPNMVLLEKVASMTGGKVNPTADDIRERLTATTERTDQSSLFLQLALLAVFLEITARELLRGKAKIRKRDKNLRASR
jgi:hypothetical protein